MNRKEVIREDMQSNRSGEVSRLNKSRWPTYPGREAAFVTAFLRSALRIVTKGNTLIARLEAPPQNCHL